MKGQILSRPLLAGPIITIKFPKLIEPGILRLPESRTGPLGIIEAKRVGPGELTPIDINPIKQRREKGLGY